MKRTFYVKVWAVVTLDYTPDKADKESAFDFVRDNMPDDIPEMEVYMAGGAEDVLTERPKEIAPEYPLSDWQYEVSNGDTQLGYAEWCLHKAEADSA
jgi:hypothetical protein